MFNLYATRIVHGTTGEDDINFSVNQYGMPNLLPSGVQYFSEGGNDHIIGTWNNDDFVLNSGTETINGNGGSDTVDYSGSPTGVVVNLNATTQHGGWAEGDQLTGISNVTGSDNASSGDLLIAKSTGSVMYGLAGNDTLLTSLGNDTVDGGAGNDTISGQLGGTDTLTGGSGKDTFFFGVGSTHFNATITDFNPLIWVNQPPSESQIIADPVHDVLNLQFLPQSGVTTDAQADAAFKLTMGTDGQMHPFAISGHDVIFTIHTADVDGTITLKGVADLLPDDHHGFTVIDHANSGGPN
jgi:Ca2+-binding RTX toxin-like protein